MIQTSLRVAAGLLLSSFIASLGVRAAVPQPVASAHLDLGDVERAVPDPARGAALFGVCASCHGPQGVGTADGTVPAIAGQVVRVIKKQLVDFRDDKRWDPRMQVIAGRHGLATAQDIADVAAFVASMRRPAVTSVGSGEFLREGGKVYRARCLDCHGPDGAGSNLRFIPRVAGQQYRYLLRQLHDSLEGRRPNMATVHERPLAGLAMPQLTGLADYMSRLALRTPHATQRTLLVRPAS